MSNLNDGGTAFDPATIPVAMRNVFSDRPQRDWLNPISMSKLKRAVEKREKRVSLNGMDFDITYGIFIDLPTSGERRECIMLRRPGQGPQAPFGYVALSTLKSFEFEED